MRITFERDGGDFPIPALNKPVTVDTSALPPEKAAHLEKLVTEAHFFDRPATVGVPPPGAVGFFTYHITVENEGQSHTVQLNDFTHEPSLIALRDYLQEEARS